MSKYIFPLLCLLFFSACSYKNKEILDIKKYSQNPSSYLQDITLPKFDKKKLENEFKNKYFQAWKKDKLKFSKEEATWGNKYASKTMYLENHLKISKKWFEKQIDNSNFKKYNTVLKKAITTKNTDLRIFPTKSKMFYNPNKAGEGFPFDYNQNSRIKINTPILISHFSKDKAWAFVQVKELLGWIRADKLLLINKEQIQRLKNSKLYVVVKEGFEVFDTNILEDLKVGTIFFKEKQNFLLATNNGIKSVLIPDYKVKKFPLDFKQSTISKIAKEFIGEPYAWGGLNNHRDCSAFTQDFFTPFGIYLKRNSMGQTQLHKYLDMSKLNDKEKKEFIIKNSIAFSTLIYMRGHIMLYVGVKNNEPLVMHNVWGVRTRQFFTEGRNIIGKTVITTLEPGIELFNVNQESTLIKRALGIVILSIKEEKKDIKHIKN